MFSALESGKVIHALFDTYAIGSERALFDKAKHLYIYKIYDYSSTYGIVFGGDSSVLQKCFDLFKRGNIADIFKNIKENIDSIEVGFYAFIQDFLLFSYIRLKDCLTDLLIKRPNDRPQTDRTNE